MSNVVKLGGGTPRGMVNEDLVTLLEDLTERARTGEFVGLAYAANDGGDVHANGWESGGHNLLLSSAVAILNARFQGVFLAD